MNIVIEGSLNQAVIDKLANDYAGHIKNLIVNRLKFIGENFINNARNNNTYKDQTGNLRSSIGYAIFYNGENLSSVFPGTDKAGAEHAQGKGKGEELAQRIADEYPTGFLLVGVAGMGYSAAVESKGYDVITNASFGLKKEFLEAVKLLNKQLPLAK